MGNKFNRIFLIIIASLFLIFSFSGASCSDSIVKVVTGGKDPTTLNKKDIQEATTKFAGWMASGAATITLIFIIWGGIQYITAAGKEDQITKAKSTLTWSIIGLILILSSYFIVKFVSDLVAKK